MSSSLNPELIFDPAGSGYHTYRIPALISAGETVLAFCEGRVNGGGDAGKIDIVLRRSTDGGTTWGPVSVVHTADDATCGKPGAGDRPGQRRRRAAVGPATRPTCPSGNCTSPRTRYTPAASSSSAAPTSA